MNDDKHSLNGMSKVDIWKQKESEKGDAIISVDENGNGHITVLLTQDAHKIRLYRKYSVLPNMEYPKTIPGLYYANMKVYELDGDIEIKWEVVAPLYPIIMEDYISLIVNSYDFNRNVFCATTDKYEVVEFDPFVNKAIEQTDAEYYNLSIAPTLIGHKFVLKSLSPNKDDVVFTTWKDKRNGTINKLS